MHFKKNVSRAIVLLCVLASLLSLLPLGASGISYDGSGTSGNGTANQTGNGTYGIYQTDMEKELIGYRFTGIDASGKRAGKNNKSLDVILDDAHYVTATGNIDNVLVMYPKYSKLEIHEVYKKFLDATNDGVDRDDYTVFSEVAGSGRKVFSSRLENPAVWASSLGCLDKMPKTAEALDVWQSKNENLDPIAKLVGYPGGIKSMGMNDKIIAEPLFVVVLEGADHALTLSELTVYVALTMLPKNINIMSDYGITGGGDKSNPTFTRKYTNYYFPNAFYTPDGQGLWGGATALGAIKGDASKFSNFPAISYGEILNKGYGAVIMYTAKEPADPGLPDYYINSIRFVDSSGREYNPEHLPMNKQLYVVVEYNCDTAIKNTKANLFIKRYTGNVYQGPSFPTSWEVVTSLSYRTGSDAQVAPWGAVRKSYSTSVTPAAITYGPDCDSYEVYALPMDPRTYEESGYINARIYKAGKTSASSSDENNTNNNTMSIRYAYQSETKRDLETVEIVLRDDSGVEYSDYSAIPYGATVHVYHRYRSGSYSMIGSTKTYFDEPACIAYAAGNDGRYYRVKIDGKETFAVAGASSSSGAKEYYVGTIDAIHLVNQTRYGAVYLEHDYGKSMADEYNKNNNTASVMWHAKCNIRLHQIILHDGKGHNYAVKTYGKSYTAPTLPVGTKVYVSYVYKNTSGRELCVDGYLGNGSTIIDEANAIYVPANGTVEVNGGSFTVGSSAGSVAGHVYVNRANYGISSSANISTFETDINDNYMKAAYNVEEGYDVGITYIQYVYIDANGNNVTQSIANGSNAVATFPRGVQVYVWYTFRNHGNKTVNIDGYFQHNGTSDWTLMNGAGSYNANGVSLAPSASVTVCIGSFKAIDLGDKYYSGAVYRHGQTDTAGDSNPNNNTMSAKYRVYGDLWIAPYITDKDGNFIDEPDTLWQMEEYNICFIIFNNTPYPQYVDVYYTPDEGEEPQLVLKNFYLAECGSDGDYYDFIAATISAETEPRASSATTRLGTYMLTAEIYYTGTKSASGECDEDGNRYNPALEQLYSADNVEYLEYAVRAEVGIVDVIFNENEYGANQFREGTTVTVHYACTNPSTVDREVYLTFQGEYVRGEDGDPIKFVIPANSTESNPYVVYVTQFVVAYNNDYGE